MLRRLAREPRHLPFLLALLVALAVAPELPSPLARPTAGWRGRYVLVYREEAAAAVDIALPALAPRAVARSTATVKIDAFSSIEPVRVDALERRLDPLDPRRDPWVAGIGGYFQARRCDRPLAVAYLPATTGRVAAWLRLRGSLADAGAPSGSWRLLEADPAGTFGRVVAALAFALAVAARQRRGRRGLAALAVGGALAWLPGLVNGGPSMLWACAAALYLWIPRVAAPPVAAGAHRPSRPTRAETFAAAARGAVLVAVALAALLPPGAVAWRVSRIAASLLALEVLAVAPWEALAPMPVRARRRLAAGAPAAALAAAVLAVVLPPLLDGTRVPLPSTLPSRTAAGDALPGLAEALSHERSLAVGASAPVGVSPPSPGPDGEERVRLRAYRFAADGTGVFEAPLTAARLPPGWAARSVAGAPQASVERLLVDQGRAVLAAPRLPLAPVLGSLPAALLLAVLVLLPLAVPSARRPLIRLGLSGITVRAARRRTR